MAQTHSNFIHHHDHDHCPFDTLSRDRHFLISCYSVAPCISRFTFFPVLLRGVVFSILLLLTACCFLIHFILICLFRFGYTLHQCSSSEVSKDIPYATVIGQNLTSGGESLFVPLFSERSIRDSSLAKPSRTKVLFPRLMPFRHLPGYLSNYFQALDVKYRSADLPVGTLRNMS